MKIAILFGKYGMGHQSAAIAIKEQIEKDLKNIEVITEDFIAYAYPGINKIMYDGFNLIVSKTPLIYTQIYKTMANKEDNSLNAQYLLAQIKKYIKEKQPDMIISTLPAVSRAVSLYKTKYKSSLPLITCITDISHYYEWVHLESNLYLVADESVKKYLVQNGVNRKNIRITGIPVKQKFHQNNNTQHSNKFNVLIMGGGLGIIPIKKTFYEKISNQDEVHVTVICGKNKTLYQQLHNKYPNVTVIGYTNEIEKHMKTHDLVITKAGGITLFECIFSNLPILAFKPFLAQEKFNAHYIEQNKIGKIMWNGDINDHIQSILNNKNHIQMKSNMQQLHSTLQLDYCKDIERILTHEKK